MKRHIALVLTAAISLLIAPSTSPGSILPNEVTVRWGPSETSTVTSIPGFSSVYSIQAAWPVSRHAYLWSSASYFGKRIQWDQTVYVSGYVPPHYSYQYDFVPVALGIRIYGLRTEETPRGPFIEAGPSLTLARYQSQGVERQVAGMGGFQAGAGIRFLGFRHTHAEVGAGYYMAQTLWKSEPGADASLTGERRRDRLDSNFATAYFALGIGR
jgi:hypothetical protein